MSEGPPLRLFLDSNVLTGGIVAAWGLDKAVLALCAARICRLVLAEIVRHEVEDNLLHHAAALPPQDAEQVLQEAGDLMSAIAAGAFPKERIHADLGEVVVGKKKGRESRDQITLFKSVGVAIEDVAVAAWVYQEAKKRGLGTNLDLQD